MRNQVRGPTSALSREKGIRIENRRDRNNEATDQEVNDENANAEAQESNSDRAIEQLSTDNQVTQVQNAEVTEHAESAPQVATSSSKSNSRKGKKKRKMSMDDDYPVNIGAPKKVNLNFCRRCCRKFLHDNQVECVACQGIKKTGQNSKKGKKVINQDGEKVLFLSLRDLCLKTVAEYIDYVEEFGDISENSKLLISKILSRQRQINNDTIRLFLGPAEKILKLFDCTLITADGYEKISFFCPNLSILDLVMCGRVMDSDIIKIVRGCPLLTSVTLDGPFLIRDGSISELANLSHLESLAISNAPKITHNSLASLANKAPLRLLKLNHCTSVGEGLGDVLSRFTTLRELELEFIGALSEPELMSIISSCGAKLKTLFLEGFDNLSDICLRQIGLSCALLNRLSLGSCKQLSSEAFCEFFNTCKSSLNFLSVNRVATFNDESLLKLIQTNRNLAHLDLNGLDNLTVDSLKELKSARELEYIDLSWVREVDNDILDSLVHYCTKLKEVKLYGCIKLTDDKLNSLSAPYIGHTLRIHGNEFD